MSVVVDASAVLAVLNGELDAERTRDIPTGSLISAINFSEALAKLVDVGLDDDDAADAFGALMQVVVPVDAEPAKHAGLLRRQTRAYGLPLGDRACLALAALRGLPVVTADRVWAELDLGIEIRFIRYAGHRNDRIELPIADPFPVPQQPCPRFRKN